MAALKLRTKLIIIILTFLILFWSPAAVIGKLLENAALLIYVRQPRCVTVFCVVQNADGDGPLPSNLKTAIQWLEKSSEYLIKDRSIGLHRAELLFYAGMREAAAVQFGEAGWPLNSGETGFASNQPPGSFRPYPLLSANRPEYYLIRAYQAENEKNWAAAENNFRIGLELSGEDIYGLDLVHYYRAAAENSYQHRAGNFLKAVESGKYFFLAGDNNQAILILEETLNAGSLPDYPMDGAWGFFYLGRAYQQIGDVESAYSNYIKGYKYNPGMILNGVYAYRLSTTKDSGTFNYIENHLRKDIPSFPLGLFGLNYLELNPISIQPSGTLLGFDIDPYSITNDPVFEVWLWWDGLDNYPADSDNIQVSKHLVQRQVVVNLIPNPSFELGTNDDGIPLGWVRRLYNDDPDSLFIADTDLEAGGMFMAQSRNIAENVSSGLESSPFPVRPDRWYLMGGQMKVDQAPNSNIARMCIGEDFDPGGPYYTNWPRKAPLPTDTWIRIADFAPLFPEGEPDTCQMLLVNFDNPGGSASWDELFLLPIELP